MSRIYRVEVESKTLEIYEDGRYRFSYWDDGDFSYWKQVDCDIYFKHKTDAVWMILTNTFEQFDCAIKEAIAHWELEDAIESILLGGEDE